MAFYKDTCLEKERVRSKVTPRKVGVGLKRRQEFNKRSWVSLVEIHREEGGLTFAEIERKTPVPRSTLQSNQILCSFHLGRDREEKGPDDQVISIKRAADGRR